MFSEMPDLTDHNNRKMTVRKMTVKYPQPQKSKAATPRDERSKERQCSAKNSKTMG
jgi:hypothetical protein